MKRGEDVQEILKAGEMRNTQWKRRQWIHTPGDRFCFIGFVLVRSYKRRKLYTRLKFGVQNIQFIQEQHEFDVGQNFITANQLP
jgi:hypothetical protein